VAVALIVAGLAGDEILSLLGLSLGGMRVGGGIIILILAIAMVMGTGTGGETHPQETSAAEDMQGSGIVPLGIPLLAGPAALSYMMSHGPLQKAEDLALVLIPGL